MKLIDPRGQFRQEDPVGATAFQVSPKINCLYGCFQIEVASPTNEENNKGVLKWFEHFGCV